MKKIKMLIALILCVTIGGVYATWLYADKNDVYDQKDVISVAMSTATSAGAYGDFTAKVNFKISIEPLKDVDPDTTVANANHIAAIQYLNLDGTPMTMVEGDVPTITFTFKPNESASKEIKENGVDAWYYLIDSTAEAAAGSHMEYDEDGAGAIAPVHIFKYGATKEAMTKISWGEADATGLFTFTVVVTDAILDLTQDFLLDTHAKYNIFNSAISGNSIVVNITDGVTA